MIHTVKDFSIINEVEWCIILNFFAFSMIQQMLAIWFLVHLPFLNLACTSWSYQFTYFAGLPWKILSIILLACDMSAIVLYFEHPFALSSVGLEWKLIFSSPAVTAAFFQICGHIECNTLTTSSFEILNSSTGIPSAPLALSVVTLPAHLTSYSRISGSRWVITPLWLSGSLRTLFVLFFCVFLPIFLISSASGPIKNP